MHAGESSGFLDCLAPAARVPATDDPSMQLELPAPLHRLSSVLLSPGGEPRATAERNCD